jgi:hypothetical protein
MKLIFLFAHSRRSVKKLFRCRAVRVDFAIAIRRNFCQVKVQNGHMRTKTAIISVENLKSEDLPALRQALQSVPGVDSVDFSVERSVAVLEFDPSQSHIDDFLRAVLKAGFKVL